MPFMDDPMLELFGDDATGDNLGVPVAQEPEHRALAQRVDQSHMTGCCQRLAWSVTGGIAYLSGDGRTIHFRTVARSPLTGEWALTGESPTPVIAPDNVSFVHLDWSGLGLDLIALDSAGNPYLFTLAFALGRLFPQHTDLTHSDDELGAVVGVHWLPIWPQQCRNPIIRPAIRQGELWETSSSIRESNSPHHPQDGKAVVLTISRSNELRMIYQRDSRPMAESSVVLAYAGDCCDFVSHAAFCDSTDFLYLATYHVSRRIRVYKIRISGWNKELPRNGQPYHPGKPQLIVEHLKLLDHCTPQIPSMMSLNHDSGIEATRLSSIHILPPSPLNESFDASTFHIICIFTHAGHAYTLRQGHPSCSVVTRWQIGQAEHKLHDCFMSLSPSTQKTSGSETITIATRLEDIVVPKVILGMLRMHYDATLAFATSDGTVDFRRSEDFSLIVADGDDAKVTSLAQVGFTFLQKERCTDMSLSPNASMAVYLRTDGTVGINVMEYLHNWREASLDDHQTQAALVCIAREFAILTSLSFLAEELLALVPIWLDKGMRRFLIHHIYRSQSKKADVALGEPQYQSQAVLRDSLLQKVFSTQLMLSYHGQTLRRDTSGNVVWLWLNLKLVCQSLAQTSSAAANGNPEVLASMRGSIKWGINLMTMIFQDLFAVQKFYKDQRDQTNTQGQQPAFHTALEPLFNAASPALHVVLCSVTRVLLRFLIDVLKIFLARVHQTKPQTIVQQTLLADILFLTSKMTFTFTHFEQLVLETDNAIRATYARLGDDPQKVRTQTEHAMWIDAEIPAIMNPVVEHLLGNVLPKLAQKVDMGALHFADVGAFGMRDGQGDVALYVPQSLTDAIKVSKFDVVRKIPLKQGMRLRTCRRCGSQMEDVYKSPGDPDARNLPMWVGSAQKFCVCLGYWMLGNGMGQGAS